MSGQTGQIASFPLVLRLVRASAMQGPTPRTTFSVVRADYLLPLSSVHGRDTRIEDGYVLMEGSLIKEAGTYTPEIGQRILRECGHSLTIIGASHTGGEIPKLHAAILPGFVKAHGHDHEATIIGLCKDVPLTQWLDGVINVFTGLFKWFSWCNEVVCHPTRFLERKARRPHPQVPKIAQPSGLS